MGNLYDKINGLCQIKGITGAKMCTDTNISKGLLTDLKKGRREGVNAKTAQKIASYFGVTVGYLLGEEDEIKKIPGEDALTEDEAEWLEVFRNTAEENRPLLLEVFRTFKMIPEETQPEALVMLRLALRMQQKP